MSKSWSEVSLGQILVRIERSEPPQSDKVYRQMGVKLWGEGAYERESIVGGNTKYSTLFRVEPEDVVINKIWARHGSVAVIQPELSGCYVSAEFPTFLIKKDIMIPRWMHWLTKTPSFWNLCDQKSQGTSGKNRIKPDQFLKIKILLPSIDEQQRLVRRIDNLAGNIERCRRIHMSIKYQFEIFKERYISKTFNNINGRTVLLKDICQTASGGTPDRSRPDYYVGCIPWVKSGELRDCKIYKSEEYISESAISETSAKIFSKGTLLIALYGATIGKTGVLEIDAATNQAICGIIPSKEIDRDFLWWFLRNKRSSFLKIGFGGAQSNISQKVLKETPIMIPDLINQHAIVEKLNHFQEQGDRLKALIDKTTEELDVLIINLLNAAYSGKL